MRLFAILLGLILLAQPAMATYSPSPGIPYVVPGTSGNVLTSNGTSWTSAAAGGGGGSPYGSGADGAVTKSNVTETSPVAINATTVTVAEGDFWFVLNHSQICATGDVSIPGSIGIDQPATNGFAGGAGAGAGTSPGGNGAGLGGGRGGVVAIAGGGGSNGGAGGAGSGALAQSQAACFSFQGGSGGGGGGADGILGVGGDGGVGGGVLRIACGGDVTIGANGDLGIQSQPGQPATADHAHGGGGGAGGTLIIYCADNVTNNGVIYVDGSAGGTGSGASGRGGGGGGGGVVWIMCAGTYTNNGTEQLTGGAAGTGTAGNGAAGSTGVLVDFTATPTLPLMNMMETPEMFKRICQRGSRHWDEGELLCYVADGNLIKLAVLMEAKDNQPGPRGTLRLVDRVKYRREDVG